MNPGDLLADRYEIVKRAGAGGMGAVYQAEDRVGGGQVAVKVTVAAADRARALREARSLQTLVHPQIVRYVDHGETPTGELYLVMEWLEGEDLAARLARAPLSLRDSVDVTRRAAEALGFAHARGLIHRDVKPGNVFLVDGDPARVKVLDFGLARAGAVSELTRTGILVGTPAYMAPEQARGAPVLDARVDVFALGCMLFKCITGRSPFQADTMVAVLAKVLIEDAPRLRDVRPDVPRELDELVAKMLAKDAAQRPDDGHVVAEALADLPLMEDLSGVQAPPSAVSMSMLTDAEQRIVSVIVTSRPLGNEDATVVAEASAVQATPSGLEEIAAGFGARYERLLDGTVVVTMFGERNVMDQAQRAARCAMAILASVPEVPVGLATGRGELSGPGVVGEAIDRAVRLTHGAARGGVVIDDITAGLLSTRFETVSDSGTWLVSERDTPEEARLLMGKHTPCVGREREIALLQGLHDECVGESAARVAVVIAAAGVGKSRLRHEWLRRFGLEKDHSEVWQARGDSLAAGSSLGMLAQLVRLTLGDPKMPAALAARVAEVVPAGDAPRVAEFLGELVGIAFPDTPQLHAARKDRRLMGDQMRSAFEVWVKAECTMHPVVIVLEDLHWGDVTTVRFIEAALRVCADLPLMVVAFARPEVMETFPRLFADRGANTIQLSDLTRRASENLVRHVLGSATPKDVVDRLVERAAGNALYLEEILRAWSEGRGERLPDTVLAMMQARLDGFGADERRVLRAASIFGETFWEEGVAELLGGTSPDEVRGWLALLVQREAMSERRQSRIDGAREMVFRHALFREAAYAMLTKTDREAGHLRAAEWLERSGENDHAALAEHFERAGAPDRAAPSYLRAAEQAMAGDLDVAVSLARRGLACATESGLRARLSLVLATAYGWSGNSKEALPCAQDAFHGLPRGSAEWFDAAARCGGAAMRLGESAIVVGMANELLDAPVAPGAELARIGALARSASQLLYAGHAPEAHRLLVEVDRRDLASLGDDPVRAPVQSTHAERSLAAGDFGTYLAHMSEISAFYTRIGDVRNACWARGNMAYAQMILGAYPAAEAALRQNFADGMDIGATAQAMISRQNLGAVLGRLGRLDEALVVTTEARDWMRANGNKNFEVGTQLYLAEILLRRKNVEAAREAARLVAEQRAVPARAASALALLARLAIAEGRVDEALTLSEQASELASKGGLEEGEALVRLARAEALWASGDRAGAVVAITAARDRLLEGAAKLTDPAWRKSFLENVEENADTLARAKEFLGL